jgi:hypothetical protein
VERIHLLISAVPEGVDNTDRRIVAFVRQLKVRSKPVITRYVPDWYFGGKVIWEPLDAEKQIVEPYNQLAQKFTSR